MKTIPEALKALYVAMGGDEADVANLTVTPDVIEALADVYEGGGGGADTFLISFTATPTEDDFTWTCDKTKAEIAAAAESGKILKAKVSFAGVAEAVTYSYTAQNGVYAFTTTTLMGSNVAFAICSENDGASGQIIPLQNAQG